MPTFPPNFSNVKYESRVLHLNNTIRQRDKKNYAANASSIEIYLDRICWFVFVSSRLILALSTNHATDLPGYPHPEFYLLRGGQVTTSVAKSKVFTGSRSRKKDFAGVIESKIYAQLPVLHTSRVNVIVAKLHVAVARSSLASTVYAYIFIFTFLNRFVFSVLSY